MKRYKLFCLLCAICGTAAYAAPQPGDITMVTGTQFANYTSVTNGRLDALEDGVGGGTGPAAFGTLTGSPSDNTALANALNAKANASALAAIATTGLWADIQNKPLVSNLGGTINLTQLPGDCTLDGQIPKRVNGAWACSADATGAGGEGAGVSTFNGAAGDILYAPSFAALTGAPGDNSALTAVLSGKANAGTPGAGTYTKITVNSTGGVTAGASATTADIAASTNRNYVTDAQLVIIGATAGTNSGDETAASIRSKLGAASGSNSGYLSSSDWTAFNAKQNALTAGVDYLAPNGVATNLTLLNPANITQTASYRLTTDAEKAAWNAKQNALAAWSDYVPGSAFSIDGTFSANSDTLTPSQKAVRTYVTTGLAAKQDTLGFTPVNLASVGAANGVASLNASGYIPRAQLGSGTPDGTKFLRDDYVWVAAGGGSASFGALTGVPADNTSLASALALKANLVSPGFTTPDIGVATATRINNVNITTPASAATLTLGSGKTFAVNNTITISGTDSATLNIGGGGVLGTAAYTASSAYESPITFSTGLTRNVNTVTVNAGSTSVPGIVQLTDSTSSTSTSTAATPNSVKTAYDLANAAVPNMRTVNGKSLSSNITLGLASSDFANQGTTTGVLHGNAAGNPSFGPVVTADITDGNVTLAKIANMATASFLGRNTAGSGVTEVLSASTAQSMLGLTGTGFITAAGNAVNGTGGFVTYGNASILSGVLTGYTSGAGTVAGTDNLLQAIQKLNGNDGLKLNLAGGTMSGAIAMGTNKITGLAAGTTNGDALRYEQVVGTYATLAGSESLTNKKLGSLTSNGLVTTSSGDGTLGVTVPGTGFLTGAAAAVNGTGGFVTYGNAAGTAAVLTGYTSGAGTVAGTDTLLQAIQKLNGNDGLKLNLAGGTMSGAIAMGTNKITGLAAGTTNGDALRYEQVVGVYAPLAAPALTGNATAVNLSVTGTLSATNGVTIPQSATAQGFDIYEASGNGTNKATLTVSALSSDHTWALTDTQILLDGVAYGSGSGSGTVNSGLQYHVAWYPTATTTVDDSAVTISSDGTTITTAQGTGVDVMGLRAGSGTGSTNYSGFSANASAPTNSWTFGMPQNESATAGVLYAAGAASHVNALSVTNAPTLSAANMTNVPAGQLSGTIPSAVLGNSTVYIGSTAVALNRTTGSLALTGITSIDGTAALATSVASGAANQIHYQTAPGTTAFLATANNGVLVTNGSGVPSVSATLPSGLTIPGYQASITFGTGALTALGNAVNGTGGFVTYGNAAGTAAVLTGYTSGAGTVAGTDTLLQAIQKLNGNDAQKMPLAGGTFTGNITLSTHDIVTDTSTGTKLATATNQKLGFFNATPVVQQTGDIVTALGNLGLVTSGTVATATAAGNISGGGANQFPYQTGSGATGFCAMALDGSTAQSFTAAQLKCGPTITNYGQAASNISHTLPTPTMTGDGFVASVGTAQGANYWRFTAGTAGTMYLDGGGTGYDYLEFTTPAVGNYFACFAQQTGASTWRWNCRTGAGTVAHN